MQSKVTNTSDYRLLPGPMNVYLNNRSVSKASMPVILFVTCSILADANVKSFFFVLIGRRPREILPLHVWI